MGDNGRGKRVEDTEKETCAEGRVDGRPGGQRLGPAPWGAGTRILRSGDCVVGVWGKERWTPSDEGQRPPEAA